MTTYFTTIANNGNGWLACMSALGAVFYGPEFKSRDEAIAYIRDVWHAVAAW